MEGGPTQRILEVVRRVPAGSVATYGQVARLAGLPGAARQVGYALARLDQGSDVPWQRIVRTDGTIAERREGRRRGPGGRSARPGGAGPHPPEDAVPVTCGARRQRELLEGEGIEFGANGRIDLARFRWRPNRRTQSASSTTAPEGDS